MDLEISKIKATLRNLINSVIMQEEGKTSVDVLGSLLALEDQIDRLDKLVDQEERG